MNGFKLWLLVLESGRFDHDGFNDVFRRQLAELLPRVSDARRRAGLEAMRGFDFVAYILAALRNAGFGDQHEREQAAHDVIVQLLVSPGSTLRRLRRHQRPDGGEVQDRRAERRAEPAPHPSPA